METLRVQEQEEVGDTTARSKFFVRGQYEHDGMLLNPYFPKESVERVKDFKFDPEDVLIATYPKSGTTWTAEIVWLIMNEADTERATKEHRRDRTMFLEKHNPAEGESHMDKLLRITGPRVMRTHLPTRYFKPHMATSNFKTIAVMRNLKDVLTSSYHFYKTSERRDAGDAIFDDLFELWQNRQLMCGDWAEMNLDWWSMRNDENVLVMKYEEMREDIVEAIWKMAEFLEKELTDEQVMKIAEHTRMDNMKKNAVGSSSRFDKRVFRKGIVGDWKTLFSPEQNQLVDEHLRTITEPEGLRFEEE